MKKRDEQAPGRNPQPQRDDPAEPGTRPQRVPGRRPEPDDEEREVE